ncbi:MAG: PIN domain-containing protein [Solirubrobacterales bacterium]|nr:PIN domain-containing protein [Solirubrobacterales bacterium]
MRLLLDTHTLLWVAEGRLGAGTRAAVAERAEAVFVSAASVWEIEVKRALGRLEAPASVADLVDRSGFERLAIDFDHALEAGRLPLIHGDPFDRMLIAQARVEGLTLATADQQISRYGVPVLAVTRD